MGGRGGAGNGGSVASGGASSSGNVMGSAGMASGGRTESGGSSALQNPAWQLIAKTRPWDAAEGKEDRLAPCW